MADAIAAVYCAAAAEGRAAVASVGAAHLPGIGKSLLEWSGGRIPLERVWSENLSEPILERLNALAASSPVSRHPQRTEPVTPKFD